VSDFNEVHAVLANFEEAWAMQTTFVNADLKGSRFSQARVRVEATLLHPPHLLTSTRPP
jgi:uncharacterized protein YjbI with pentapeptide repeats